MSDDFDRLAEEEAFLEGFKPIPEVLGDDVEASVPITPKAIDISVEWLGHREGLRKIKKVSRELEMTCDMFLDGMEMIQFCNDVELYGLYAAVLSLPEQHKEKVMDEILVDIRLKALPRRDISHIKPSGVVKQTKRTGLRPESIWSLQKELILNVTFDSSAKAIFESVLPFSAPEGVPRPFTSHDFVEIAKSTNVWHAVREAPIKYREALCQRLLIYYDIPAPTSKPLHHHVRPSPSAERRDRVLVIDKAGNAWTWNCGWFRVGENGHRLDAKPVMGHASFKRRITPAGPDDFARSSFRYTRPWGQWRRGSGPVYSDIYKMSGTLILTDGIHAVVEFADGIKREVVLDNLTSISERTVRRAAPSDKPKAPSTKKTKKELSLEEMMKML